MGQRGRPKAERIVLICGNPRCPNGVGGQPAELHRLPSQVPATGRAFCDAICRGQGGGNFKAVQAQPICEKCGKPITRKGPSGRRFHKECYDEERRAQVTTKCEWCGGDILAAASRKRRYHETEAPEPECGWPEGVRMSCYELGRFKNVEQPLRFVNDKPVRIWLDRRRDVERAQVWDPSAANGAGGWVFEHRWNWEQEHGTKLSPDVHIHHHNGDKANNDPGNCEALTPSEHAALHNAERNHRLAEARRTEAKLKAMAAELAAMGAKLDEFIEWRS